jgi:hypothetical protein
MMAPCSALAGILGSHTRLVLLLAAAGLAGGWGLHVWQLRRRERRVARLVDEQTRLWQQEASAHVVLRAQLAAAAAGGAANQPARPARVLVVGERRDQHEAMTAVFEGLGITPAYADSHWAASVAARRAGEDGEPYDLILIDSALEGAGMANVREALTTGRSGEGLACAMTSAEAV